jgi:hypothetical protein
MDRSQGLAGEAPGRRYSAIFAQHKGIGGHSSAVTIISNTMENYFR